MNKSYLVLTIVVLTLVSASLFGWQYFKDLGGGLDEGRSIDVCADGGFFLSGRSNAWALGGFATNWYDHEFFLVKLDSIGTEEWIRHYGQNGDGFYDASWCVCGTPDSGAIMAGKTQSPKWVDVPYGYTTYYDDMLIVRVDKNGDTLWTRSYGGNRFDRAWWIKSIPESNDFFLTGPCSSFGPDMPSTDHGNIWIMRIDSVGNVLGESLWADSTRDGASDVRWGAFTPEGGCIVVGSTDLRDTSYYYAPYDSIITHRVSRIVLVKTDSLCNILWSKVYDRGLTDHYPRSITACKNGGYNVLVRDKWPAWTLIMHIDESGDTLWSKYVGLDPADTTARLANFNMIVNDAGDGYYLAGSGQGWAWVIRTDENLDEMWRVPANIGSHSEVFLDCVLTNEGGCSALGYTYSLPPTAYMDIFAMRVTRFGEDYVSVSEGVVEKPAEISLWAYPNPFNSSVKISLSGVVGASPGSVQVGVQIFDISGRLVADMPVTNNAEELFVPTPLIWTPDKSLGSGTYLVRTSGEKSIACRVVYLK